MVRYLFENSLKADKYLNPGEVISLKFQVSSSKLPVAKCALYGWCQSFLTNIKLARLSKRCNVQRFNLEPQTLNFELFQKLKSERFRTYVSAGIK